MSTYHVGHRAQADLAEIWLYIADDRPSAADRLLTRIEQYFAMLAANPEFGEECNELAPDVRQSTVGNYVVLYRHRPERIEIIRDIHGARNFAEEFRRHWFK